MTENVVIWWVRRDLRLADNPGLTAAVGQGGAVIPVFVRDETTDALGAAPKWRLGLGLEAFDRALRAAGSGLVLRSGDALTVLRALADETGARAVVWNRLYDDVARNRDAAVKAGLKDAGIAASSHGGHLLHEPWTIETGQGGFYRVYSPFWRAVKGREVDAPVPAPARLSAPKGGLPPGERLADWALGRRMNRGAEVVARHVCVGEARARDRLDAFIADKLAAYRDSRDFPARDGTSRLSENLTYGEIGPRTIWTAGYRAWQEGAQGAETFLKELVWREFAYHLLYHTPQIQHENWRPEWDAFPWRDDTADAGRWRQGRTGVPFVDAGLREMYVTGTMHNRARMVAASYLTKHLMTHWKIGLDWFADCLIDWDPASNAMGWQWAAGSGPDAAPYFRIFNPAMQAERFDKSNHYRTNFIAEISDKPRPEALAYFDAVPRAWGLSPDMDYLEPVVDLAEGRARALEAYGARAGRDAR